MIYKEITVSRAHQFNDPHESFANHRVSVSVTAQIAEDENVSSCVNATLQNLDAKVKEERERIENRRTGSQLLVEVRSAIERCKSHDVKEERGDDDEITDWEHDLALLSVLEVQAKESEFTGCPVPEVDNSKFRKVSIFCPF